MNCRRTISNRRGSVPARVGGQNPCIKNAAAKRFASADCSLPGDTEVCCLCSYFSADSLDGCGHFLGIDL